MTVILVAGCNQRYHQQFQGCVDALKAHANAPYQLFSVGYDGGPGYTPLTHAQNHGAPPETECIQHGSFLQALPGGPDDMIVYLDGDVVMQRPFDAAELEWLGNFPANAVSATWNQIGETLAGCIQLIGPKLPMDSLTRVWGDYIHKAPSLNVGVVAARRQTWEYVYRLYMGMWGTAGESFTHQARQQWLMCWAYASFGLDIQIMPWHFHAHGHFGLKPGMERRTDGIYADGKLAAFRHKL